MEEKLYIVVEECWEYNDEYYYQPDDEPYTLYNANLLTKDDAEKLATALNEKRGWVDERFENGEEVDYHINPFKVIKLTL